MIPNAAGMYESRCMREGIEVRLRAGDRERLERIGSDRKTPQHHVWRARIVLMTADALGLGSGEFSADFRDQARVTREAEDVVDAVGLAPAHQARLEQRPENSPMKTAMYCGRVVS